MIKRIRVRNFLSLRDVDVELGSRNVFVGPNMSGKSNLIECLKFLRDAISQKTTDNVSPLQEAIFRRGGFNEVVWKGQPEGPISFVIIAELDEPTGNNRISYSYEFSLRYHEYGHTYVEAEKLTVDRAGKNETILNSAAGRMTIVDGGITTEQPQNTLGLELQMLGRHGPSVGGRFREFLASWRFYHLVPELMRKSNPPSWEKFLSEHGNNLSAWLLTLQNYTEEFRRIKQVCYDVLPGLGDLLFQPVEPPRTPGSTGHETLSIVPKSAEISVGTNETHFKRPISLARMSAGELSFLGLISIILAPEELSPPLVCIEEPDNYLHPRLVEIVVELLNQRAMEARAPQILLTTHSPLLIDKLTIDDLLVLDKVNGATRFTRPSTKKHLRKLLSRKEVSLGDLWYSGALSDS